MSYNLLLVDDDREFREALRDILEDYKVIEVSSGEDALKALKKPNEIDLIILDVMMPGMRGTEVLRQIKNIAPDVGIIILTGHSSEDVAIQALKGHADDYIEKPVDVSVITESIEKLLAKINKELEIEACGIKEKIEKVKRFTERNCFKKTTLIDAARSVYLSPKYLSRIFKKGTGISYSSFRIKIKINQAKKILEKTGYNINQISYRLGYENTESFIRQFKKLAGCSPSEYRRKMRNPKAAKHRPKSQKSKSSKYVQSTNK